MDKPPFDPIKFACYLVAAVLAVECIVVLVGMMACLMHAQQVISDQSVECDPKDRLGQLLTAMLAAALAMLGGFRSGK